MGCSSSAEQGRDVAPDDKDLRKEEAKIEGKINYKPNDPRFIEMAKWPCIVLDTTGSMRDTAAVGSAELRMDVAKRCVAQLMEMLTPVNDADDAERFRGLPLITFNTQDGGLDRGLINRQNFEQIWSMIHFRSHTHIMDGMRTMMRVYEQHFTDRHPSTWPLLLATIITDGVLEDAQEFEEHLKHVHGRVFIEIAVIGWGEDHDKAVRHYNKISARHPHVRCTAFQGNSNPREIAEQLLRTVDVRLLRQGQGPAPAQASIQGGFAAPPPYSSSSLV